MRIVFFGSGAFGEPTFRALREIHEIILVVTQPDRPAGRRQKLSPTPIAAIAEKLGIPSIKPEDVNDPSVVREIRSFRADAFVVIAFGQKLGPELLADQFAINLHASLLPRYRGAAPINWAMINGDEKTGVSIITLAPRMDAGEILMQRATPIRTHETAGELHDRLAELGAAPTLEVLQQHAKNALQPVAQDHSAATRAPKLTRADGIIDFTLPAQQIRARIHGLNPWPGCTVFLANTPLKILRVEAIDETTAAEPGTILDDGTIACGNGRLRLLSVQPAGGKSMAFTAFRHGHAVQPGDRLSPSAPPAMHTGD